MIRKPLFKEVFSLLFIVAVINIIAIKFYLYWTLKEFDSFVHFLGGAWVALLFMWLFFYSGLFAPKDRNLKNFLIVSVLAVILVGTLWEIFELLVGATDVNDPDYSFDTTLDLIMDTLGAICACFYSYIKEINLSFIKRVDTINNANKLNEQEPE